MSSNRSSNLSTRRLRIKQWARAIPVGDALSPQTALALRDVVVRADEAVRYGRAAYPHLGWLDDLELALITLAALTMTDKGK